ncbi:MAG: NAD(P)H-hydrate dehydratase [Verrucomicrobiota bacterium]
MKVVSAEQMRELDRKTIEEFGTPGETLMDRAGLGLAEIIRRHADDADLLHPVALGVAGKGNNGGDVFVAARYLKTFGFDMEVWLAGSAGDLEGDAREHLKKMEADGLVLRELPAEADWQDVETLGRKPDYVIDGVLGTGVSGPARGTPAAAIRRMNAMVDSAWIVAVDIPSGLDPESGEAEGEAVKADLTVTMGLPKTGLLNAGAIEHVGGVQVVDIGIPDDYVENVKPEKNIELICEANVRPLFAKRKADTHKGSYGHVLMMGGSKGYSGAIIMAARAALRGGAGLVTVLTPYSVLPLVAASYPEIMTIGSRETGIGSLDSALWDDWRTKVEAYDALLIGPGLSRHDESLALIRRILRDCPIPMVVDADAIAVLNGQPHWIEKAECDVVITPHPGEMAGLFGQTVEEVQSNRHGMAMAAAKYTASTVVLKGVGTIVSRIGRPTAVNLNGNPGMATGGTGDALAGLMTALMAQGINPYKAARAAVWLHGRAGDLAALKYSQAGMMTGDLIDEIPRAFRSVSVR